MTPEQLIARNKKLASAARALVTGDLGLVPASLLISRVLRTLEGQAPTDFDIFDEFYKAIPLDIPLGVARLQWHVDPLLECDTRLVAVENRFRPALLRAALEIIKEFGQEVDGQASSVRVK